MPRPRFLNLDAARRNRLLEAAADEFAAHGYEQASLNKVIERLGLSKGQFYYYFDDKADLFGAVLDWAWRRVLPDTLFDFSRLEAETFWSTLEQFGEGSRDVVRTMPWWIGLWRHLYHPPEDPAIRQVVAEKFELGRQIQLSFVRRGQEIGCIRRDLPDDLLLAVISAFDMAADRWLIDNWDALTSDQRETLPHQLFSVVRRMIELPPPTQEAG
ncbi:MAG: TetR family transcriptional regulator [Luteitalea sp.]|nr:TetR family transcriptional regulator [Luteitalea sp.]